MCNNKVEQTDVSLQSWQQTDRQQSPQRLLVVAPLGYDSAVREPQAPADQHRRQAMAVAEGMPHLLTVDGKRTKSIPVAAVKPIVRSNEPATSDSSYRPPPKIAERSSTESSRDVARQSTSLVSDIAPSVGKKPLAASNGDSVDSTRSRVSTDGGDVKRSPTSLPSSACQLKRAEVAGSSPSVSITQPIPDGYVRIARCAPPSSEADEARLMLNCRQLEQSTYYVGDMSSNEAKERLRNYPVGTFLVRNSAHPRFLYSLSVKTRRGVTSIRLAYDSNGFSLDAEPDQSSMMRSFNTVVELVTHYTVEGRQAMAHGGSGAVSGTSCVFLERSGRRDLPVLLCAPYLGGCGGASGVVGVSSLKHLSRLAINASLAGRNADRLAVQPTLKNYLRDYPYDI